MQQCTGLLHLRYNMVKTVKKKMKERDDQMNFNDKRVRRIVSVIILLLVAAMVLTMVLPYIV